MVTSDTDPNSTDWIRQAVDRYERPLTLYAAKFVGDLERARDIVQDTFLRLCSQDRAKVERNLSAWLYTVCRNRAVDMVRDRARTTQMDERTTSWKAGDTPQPDMAAEHEESTGIMLRLLEELPEHQQEVIRLRFQHGLTYREIEQVTGRPLSTVGFLIHEGLKTIRARMEPTHDKR